MSRTTPVALACALLLLLTLPTASSAAVTVGSALSAFPTESVSCGGGPCSGYVVRGFGRLAAVPHDGVLTRWRTRAPTNTPTAVRLQVARPAGGTNRYRRIAEAVGPSATQALARFEARIPVRTGDVIGIASLDGSTLPMLNGAGSARLFTPTLTEAPAESAVGEPGELPIAADVELDADGDGYGDETQDACPADAARQAAPCSGVVVGPDVRWNPFFGTAAVTGGLETRVTHTGPGAAIVPADGVLVRARVLANQGTFGVQVLRRAGSELSVAGQTPLAPPARAQEDGAYAQMLHLPVRIPVAAGDLLGIRVAAGSSFAIRSDGVSLTAQYDPALAPGTSPDGPPFEGPVYAAINGDVEPDADRDGYGDATQDGCPTDGAVIGACPVAAPPPGPPAPAPQVVTVTQPGARVVVRPGAARLAGTRLRYRGTRSLAVPLTCPAVAESCQGVLQLKVGGRSAGQASFSLRAGQRKTVAVRLSARARRALRRGGRVGVRIVPAGPKATNGALTLTR